MTEPLENADDDTWLDDEEPDADDDAPQYEDPDDAFSDMFTWFWGELDG